MVWIKYSSCTFVVGAGNKGMEDNKVFLGYFFFHEIKEDDRFFRLFSHKTTKILVLIANHNFNGHHQKLDASLENFEASL